MAVFIVRKPGESVVDAARRSFIEQHGSAPTTVEYVGPLDPSPSTAFQLPVMRTIAVVIASNEAASMTFLLRDEPS